MLNRIKSTCTDKDSRFLTCADKNYQFLTPASFVSLLGGQNQLANKSYSTLLAAIVSFRMLKLTCIDKAIQNFTPNFSYLLSDIDSVSLSFCHCVYPIMILSSIEVDKSFC